MKRIGAIKKRGNLAKERTPLVKVACVQTADRAYFSRRKPRESVENPLVILLTGASKGIGAATADLLRQQGHHVVAVSRSPADTAGQLNIAADISREEDVKRTIDTTLAHFGRLDAVIANAGVGSFTELENFSAEEFDRIFATNVRGTFLLAKYATPHFKARRSGHFIGIASDVAKRTFAHGTAYGASKFAQDALFGSLRKEVRPFGVKVSVIYPGMVDTYFNGEAPGDPAKTTTHLRAEDVANAIVYVLNQPAAVVVDELMLHPLTQEW
jgi:NADP-dependent 3-hydroxy acid dehydrogenase YdfG